MRHIVDTDTGSLTIWYTDAGAVLQVASEGSDTDQTIALDPDQIREVQFALNRVRDQAGRRKRRVEFGDHDDEDGRDYS